MWRRISWFLACVVTVAIILRLNSAPALMQGRPTPTDAPMFLMKIEFQGGLCVYGGCYGYTTLYKDGTIIHSDAPDQETTGKLDLLSVDALAKRIEAADYAALRSVPFTGTCPTAYDGQEIIYTFYTSRGPEVISDCQYVIDYKAPLFSKVNELLPLIGTAVAPLASRTPTANIAPTQPASNSLEALLQKLQKNWSCMQSKITQTPDGPRTIYALHCQIAAASSIDVRLEAFATEAETIAAYKPIAASTPTEFHGLPAAEGVPERTRDYSTEYMIIRANRLIIIIDTRLDEGFGTHARDAAEALYRLSNGFDLKLQEISEPTIVSTFIANLAATPKTLDAMLEILAKEWTCFDSGVSRKSDESRSTYVLHCDMGNSKTVDVRMEVFAAEAAAIAAYKPVDGAEAFEFYGLPAAAVIEKRRYDSSEYVIFRTGRTIVTIYSHLDGSYGLHARVAAEEVYQRAQYFGLFAMITPTPAMDNSLMALLQRLQKRWSCMQSAITQKPDGPRMIYTLHCQVAMASSTDVSLEMYDTEAEAIAAYLPVAGAETVDFHGLPAAAGVIRKSKNDSTEYTIVRANRLIITVYAHLDQGFGMHAKDAAEALYRLSNGFELKPERTPTPTITPSLSMRMLETPENVFMKLAQQWACPTPDIRRKRDGQRTLDTLHCEFNNGRTLDVSVETYVTVPEATAAYQPIAGAETVVFHGLPAAARAVQISKDFLTEYMIVRANRFVITIYMSQGLGGQAKDVEEAVYRLSNGFDLRLQGTPTPTIGPSITP